MEFIVLKCLCLRYYETPEMKKGLRRMKYRSVNKLVDQKKKVEDEGEPVRLTSGFKKSKQWFDAQYQDSVAIALSQGSNASLFITVSGRDNVEEVRQVSDVRKESESTCLTYQYRMNVSSFMFHVEKSGVSNEIEGDLG